MSENFILLFPFGILSVMRTFHQLPGPALRPYVACLWGWQCAPGEVVALPELLPGTGAELYFHTGTPFAASAGQGELLCLRGCRVALGEVADAGFIAVRFRIGMLARFTDVPMAELVDQRLSVDTLWGRAGSHLLSRLGDAAELSEQLGLIENFLRQQLRERAPDALVEQAMPLLYRSGAALSIEWLAELSGLGRRQLERRWLRASGVTAANMRGLCRFQHSVRALLLDPAAEAVETAIAHGYYDQAHFCRDWKSRLGQSPRAFLQAARTRTHFYNTPAATPGMLTTPQLL